MYKSVLALFAAISCGFLLPAPAHAGNCKPPCANVEASVKPTSVIPNPDDAERFIGDITTLNLARNGSHKVALNFGFQIGSQTFTSLFVNENGAVSFGSPIPTGANPELGATFQPVRFLSQLGVPVIAPFYADLASVATPTDGHIGNVVVQYGTAVPYASGGPYQTDQFQHAVRITWNGLTNLGPINTGDTVYAELLLTGNNNGTSSFEFRYGPLTMPGQKADGSIAGFVLGTNAFQFTGPYTNGIPTYFEFDEGHLVGPLASSGVPEPKSWLLLLVGFALVGAAHRRRKLVEAPQ